MARRGTRGLGRVYRRAATASVASVCNRELDSSIDPGDGVSTSLDAFSFFARGHGDD